ncbi:hypothetical protein BC939DRAFT_299135, partial [Gamsiella multidivaricata]|uniref:uncharacterized protein n=1 Tax=Gamsiella multidivaricata TaxID=101098 RepID=UPI00221E66E5
MVIATLAIVVRHRGRHRVLISVVMRRIALISIMVIRVVSSSLMVPPILIILIILIILVVLWLISSNDTSTATGAVLKGRRTMTPLHGSTRSQGSAACDGYRNHGWCLWTRRLLPLVIQSNVSAVQVQGLMATTTALHHKHRNHASRSCKSNDAERDSDGSAIGSRISSRHRGISRVSGRRRRSACSGAIDGSWNVAAAIWVGYRGGCSAGVGRQIASGTGSSHGRCGTRSDDTSVGSLPFVDRD